MIAMRVYTFSKNQDEVAKAVSLYREGKNTVEIAKLMGKSRASISNYLKHASVEVKSYTPPRTVELDVTFFDNIDSEKKAYWLGFLLADGHLTKRALRTELSAKDKDHLQKLIDDLNSTAKIREQMRGNGKNDNLHPSVFTIFCSTPMCDTLRKMGWDNFKKKGDCQILDSVPNELRHHTLRGLFDGDGSVITNGARLTFIDAHPQPVGWFQRHLLSMDPTIRIAETSSVNVDQTSWIIRWSGLERIRRIQACLYKDATVFLARKKEKIESLLHDSCTETTANSSQVTYPTAG